MCLSLVVQSTVIIWLMWLFGVVECIFWLRCGYDGMFIAIFLRSGAMQPYGSSTHALSA
jgi:hypothetical protein